MVWRIRILLCIAILCMANRAHADDRVPVPVLEHHVTDQVSLLTSTQRESLEAKLAAYESAHGTQIAVLLMSKTTPDAMEQYGIRVFDAWKLGHLKINDGLLIIVAKDNPHELGRLRIEVGRGLEGAITDAQARRVLDEIIAPRFRADDFAVGLDAAVDKLTGMLDTDRGPGTPVAASDDSSSAVALWVVIALVLLVAIVIVALWWLSQRNRRYPGGSSWASSSGSTDNGVSSGSFWSSGGSGSSSSSGGFSGGGGDGAGGGASGDF